MDRLRLLIAGLIGGTLLAGVGVGLLVPLAPVPWRTPTVIWGGSAAVVALAVGALFLIVRPRRE
ncbi:MAG: hypothetical protein AB7H96_06245 [Vicinamibacterales bacterium]